MHSNRHLWSQNSLTWSVHCAWRLSTYPTYELDVFSERAYPCLVKVIKLPRVALFKVTYRVKLCIGKGQDIGQTDASKGGFSFYTMCKYYQNSSVLKLNKQTASFNKNIPKTMVFKHDQFVWACGNVSHVGRSLVFIEFLPLKETYRTKEMMPNHHWVVPYLGSASSPPQTAPIK